VLPRSVPTGSTGPKSPATTGLTDKETPYADHGKDEVSGSIPDVGSPLSTVTSPQFGIGFFAVVVRFCPHQDSSNIPVKGATGRGGWRRVGRLLCAGGPA
jgi:hypothetical protein